MEHARRRGQPDTFAVPVRHSGELQERHTLAEASAGRRSTASRMLGSRGPGSPGRAAQVRAAGGLAGHMVSVRSTVARTGAGVPWYGRGQDRRSWGILERPRSALYPRSAGTASYCVSRRGTASRRTPTNGTPSQTGRCGEPSTLHGSTPQVGSSRENRGRRTARPPRRLNDTATAESTTSLSGNGNLFLLSNDNGKRQGRRPRPNETT